MTAVISRKNRENFQNVSNFANFKNHEKTDEIFAQLTLPKTYRLFAP